MKVQKQVKILYYNKDQNCAQVEALPRLPVPWQVLHCREKSSQQLAGNMGLVHANHVVTIQVCQHYSLLFTVKSARDW